MATKTGIMSATAIDLALVVTKDNETTNRTRKSRGRHMPPDRSPEVIEMVVDGKPAVKVELFGSIANRYGKGAAIFMLLDAEDWERISPQQEWWALAGGENYPQIASGKTKLASLVPHADKTRPNLTLARLIMGAKQGQYVSTIPGKPLDLRKSQLWLSENKAEWEDALATRAAFRANLKLP